MVDNHSRSDTLIPPKVARHAVAVHCPQNDLDTGPGRGHLLSGSGGIDSRSVRALQRVPRGIPEAGSHPGNVFLLGQPVTIPTPHLTRPAATWRATDEQGRDMGQGPLGEPPTTTVELGPLEIGWYRISFRDETSQEIDWTTAAVLAPLRVATPQDSPICVDSATAWFAKNDPHKQEQLSRLAALSGVNWVRDRMRWRDLQPDRERFADATTYDTSAELQHRFGLKVLQVFHDTPPWATAARGETGRFPGDLRGIPTGAGTQPPIPGTCAGVGAVE